jgi:hypothetical protein
MYNYTVVNTVCKGHRRDLVGADSDVIGELLHDLLEPRPHLLAGRGRVEPCQSKCQSLDRRLWITHIGHNYVTTITLQTV